jgi:hypothetical protein
MMANYLAWDKTVQTLDSILSIASRPGYCANPTCLGSDSRFLSAEAQQIAPSGFTYGYDVVARIGWQRQERRDIYTDIQADLASRIQISESHVRYLYQQVYLPLLACHERTYWDRLAQAAQRHGGLIIALDGLAPEGGEPQLWFIRELLTNLTLRSGWLSRFDQPTFETFLQPLGKLPWPILAVLSDKQRGLLPAVATVLSDARHHFCHAHYLDNLAEPLADADTTFKVDLRKAVREEVGVLIRVEKASQTAPSNVLTVTGLLPDEPSTVARSEIATSESSEPMSEAAQADAVVTHLLRHTRYLLTIKGRPPFRLAGIEMYQRLKGVVALTDDLLAHRHDPRMADLNHGIRTALSSFEDQCRDLLQGAVWLRDIDQILTPADNTPVTGEYISQQLRTYLDELLDLPDPSPLLDDFRHHLDKVSSSYWPGLFHCYDLEGLPRTNNDMESLFRDTKRRLLRTTGQKGQTRRTLQRTGAWELLPRPPNEAECLDALRQVPKSQLDQERERFNRHQERFLLHSRSTRRIDAQFDKLRQQWLSLAATSTG